MTQEENTRKKADGEMEAKTVCGEYGVGEGIARKKGGKNKTQKIQATF